MCFVYKIRLAIFFLPVITQVINFLNGIERHHLLFNTVGQNSCPLIFDNNHSKFSVICVRCMYKYLALCYFFPFLIRRRLSFFKDISCLNCVVFEKFDLKVGPFLARPGIFTTFPFCTAPT